jgi:hypothetical protein
MKTTKSTHVNWFNIELLKLTIYPTIIAKITIYGRQSFDDQLNFVGKTIVRKVQQVVSQ